MPMVDSFLQELEQEAATTRRVLERVPDGKLAWKPHEKSMSLGQLAMHIATTPGGVAKILREDTCDVASFDHPPEFTKNSELLAAFEQSLADAKEILRGFDDAKLMKDWTLTGDGKEILRMPRIAVVRTILLNHFYHHRGQLTVYIRLLDVPVPSIYGPTADENPFEKM